MTGPARPPSALESLADRFVEAYLGALESLHRDGARATLEALMRSGADA